MRDGPGSPLSPRFRGSGCWGFLAGVSAGLGRPGPRAAVPIRVTPTDARLHCNELIKRNSKGLKQQFASGFAIKHIMGISGVSQPSCSPKRLQRPRRLWVEHMATTGWPVDTGRDSAPGQPRHGGPHMPSLPHVPSLPVPSLPARHQSPRGSYWALASGSLGRGLPRASTPRTGPFPSHSLRLQLQVGAGEDEDARFPCSDPQ